ncbi:MAG: HD domain-containing protein [Clostridia bacterium]|nr:HD domain-containing protein [Clostridia bacterium]
MQEQTYPTELAELARLFQEAGFSLYGVGGMVRNPLLGLPISDMDVTSAMRPEAVRLLCKEKSIRCVPTGMAFGMVELHVAGYKFEHTTFRADTYGPGGGHRPEAVTFSDTVEADAFRRDFTVNALYRDLTTHALLDPTGGLQDLRAGLLRATSPNPERIMGDDALRVLRLARFSAELGFSPEERTFCAAKAFAQGLKDISQERIRDELSKILLADGKYGKEGAVYRGLSLLNGLGGLDVILPELTKGRGVSQRAEFHAYDVLEHCLHAAACAEAWGGLILRLAALLHDVGKPIAMAKDGRMYNHDRLGGPLAREILKRLRYPNAIVEEASALVGGHMYDLDGRAKEGTLRRKFVEWGYERSRLMAALRRADVIGSGRGNSIATAVRWDRILDSMRAEKAPFNEGELAITGDMLMEALGLPPGPEVGRIKRALLLHCASKPKDNTAPRLLRLARDAR